MSLAFALAGLPEKWSHYASGGLPWHPAGSRFVGAGFTERGVPFHYHADWGSQARWGVEFHTDADAFELLLDQFGHRNEIGRRLGEGNPHHEALAVRRDALLVHA